LAIRGSLLVIGDSGLLKESTMKNKDTSLIKKYSDLKLNIAK